MRNAENYQFPVGTIGIDCCHPLANSINNHFEAGNFHPIILVCAIHLLRNVDHNQSKFYKSVHEAIKDSDKYAEEHLNFGPAPSSERERKSETDLLLAFAEHAKDVEGEDLLLTFERAKYQVRTLYSLPTFESFNIMVNVMLYLWVLQHQPRAAHWFFIYHTKDWTSHFNCNSADPENKVFGKAEQNPDANRIEVLQRIMQTCFCSKQASPAHFLKSGLPAILQGFTETRLPEKQHHSSSPPTQLFLLLEKPCDWKQFRQALDFLCLMDAENSDASVENSEICRECTNTDSNIRAFDVTRIENIEEDDVPNQLSDEVQNKRVRSSRRLLFAHY